MDASETADPLNSRDFAEDADPIALFEAWLKEAWAREPNDANAMTLATAGADGLPDARMVLLKGFDARGFVFYTNAESAKGEEIAANPQAAVLFHWKSLRRQVRARGAVEPATAEESDAYFASRPRDSQIGAWASRQSRVLASRAALEQAVAENDRRFSGGAVPRPPYWRGFRVMPLRIEFWHDRPFRLHDRIVFERDAVVSKVWRRERLFP